MSRDPRKDRERKLRRRDDGRCKVCGERCASLDELVEDGQQWDTCSGCDEDAQWSIGREWPVSD